ncbi:hypothetical protein CLIB1444_01S01574 [[Candida] jaroonii]|uniref:Uncharacterized protein n=1 Tax=[Candida] jaroonii TaxID=467808 RepID=A0ACA9Y105_9ASCO|nr:hypothetical protein CLIB1444_01S01574 [[Candida] jaroonii]
MGKRISASDREEIIKYHREQVKNDPQHKQSETIRHFSDRFKIAKSSLVRWLNHDQETDNNKVKEEPTTSIPSTPRRSSQTLSSPRRIPRKRKLSSSSSQRPRTSESTTHQVSNPQSNGSHHNSQSTDVNSVIFIQILSSIIQFYTELRIIDELTCINEGFVREVTDKIHQLYPDIEIPDVGFILSQLNDIKAIDELIKSQSKVENSCDKLSKETYRLWKLFKPYNDANIYQFRDFTLDITDMIELINPDINFKRLFVTIGIGFNLTGDNFLKPLIINNFIQSTDENDLVFNTTGLNSYYIMNQYLTKLNSILNTKILLILDKNCSNILVNKFTNIEIMYSNLPMTPMDFGLENLFVKNFQVNIVQQLIKNFNLAIIPSIFHVTYNDLVFKFLNHSNYRDFLMHSINLCMNKEMRTNFKKYVRVNLVKGLKLRDRIFLLKINEDLIKSKLDKLGRPKIYEELETVLIPQYSLDTIIKSNFIVKNDSRLSQNFKSQYSTDLNSKINQILDFRNFLVYNSNSEDTLRFFDLFYSSLSSNLLNVKDEFEYYEEESDGEDIKEEDSSNIGRNGTDTESGDHDDQSEFERFDETDHEQAQMSVMEIQKNGAEEEDEEDEVFEDANSDNEMHQSISSQQAQDQISQLSRTLNTSKPEFSDMSDSEEESEIFELKRQKVQSPEMKSLKNSFKINVTSSLVDKSSSNSSVNNTPSQVLAGINDTVDLDRAIQVQSSPDTGMRVELEQENEVQSDGEEALEGDKPEQEREQEEEQKSGQDDLGAPEEGATGQKVPEDEAPEQRSLEQGPPDHEFPEQEAPEQEAPEQEAPEQQVPEQTSEQEEITDAQIVVENESLQDTMSIDKKSQITESQDVEVIATEQIVLETSEMEFQLQKKLLKEQHKREKRERRLMREQKRKEKRERRERREMKKRLKEDSPFTNSQQIEFSQSQYFDSSQSLPTQTKSSSQSQLGVTQESAIERELERLENRDERSSYSEMDYDDNEDM